MKHHKICTLSNKVIKHTLFQLKININICNIHFFYQIINVICFVVKSIERY